jgi:hypothetical protein
MYKTNMTLVFRCTFLILATLELPLGLRADSLKITRIEPTPLFPKAEAGRPLRQVVRLNLENAGIATEAKVKIALAGVPAYEASLGTVGPQASTKDILVPEIVVPAELTVELFAKDSGRPADVKKVVLQPQRKWRIYCVSYSHHDLGFGDYPHRLRTDIRHANIERPLKFCRETDSWDEDSRFRYVIETSEPITSFLAMHGEADAAELGRRIKEGRIQIGGVHTTVNTEQLGHELMARLFYLTNRHTRDLLGAPPAKTGQIDDVIGLTWPLATFCHEAGVPYFFHGHNGCADCFRPASAEPVFFWQGPGGVKKNRVLVNSRGYGYDWDSLRSGDEQGILRIISDAEKKHWPFDALLSQDGSDFQLITMDNAVKIHKWNAKWAYPRLVSATMDMFFDAIAAQADPAKIKTFAKDGNNQWADQDSTAAMALAEARRQGEAIPTAEKFAAIASVLAGGDYPWTDIYQAYHRLLLFHEHTEGPDNAFDGSRENTQRVETEQAELREMADDAKFFTDRARQTALNRLAGLVGASAARTVIVFNPLNHARTDLVRFPTADLDGNAGLVDATTGKAVPWQREGEAVGFVATDVPSLGYKCFRMVPKSKTDANPPAMTAKDNLLENRFYRIQFDAATGAVTSIFDKDFNVELVDPSAPHKFNEYLYERFETPDVKNGSKWHRVQSAKLHAEAGQVAARMTVHATAVGAKNIVQSVTLYDGLKRIDFALEFIKSPSGRTCRNRLDEVLNKESVYAALPLQVPDFQFHHEVPGCVEEPVKDLFSGACTAYYAVRHFSDVSGPRYGVTVSTPESALVEYDHPRSCPNPLTQVNLGNFAHSYEMEMVPPTNSRMYLYLMNNMFDVNIPLSQAGPARFTWSLRSHPDDWKEGGADRFGWETLNPLIAKVVVGKQAGPLPESESSFLTVDQPNVVCTTVKPAEANGRGIILRFVETQGKPTTASFRAAFFGTPDRAIETSLVEEDRTPLKMDADGNVAFTMTPFGVKTIRLVSKPPRLPAPRDLVARPLSDMEVELRWAAPNLSAENRGYYNVYRGTKPDFQPGLLNLVQRVAGTSAVDRPVLHFGGWINNRLEPETAYFYRVSAVDRWNNESAATAAVKATTLKSSESNAVPNRVERLSAILISPPGLPYYVNLLFRTNCESDVVRYEIHRSTTPGFTPIEKTHVGEVDANAIIKGSTAYGHTPIDRRMKEFDHIMFQDNAVEPGTTYYYRVRAVDAAGRKGPFSDSAAATTPVASR